MQGLGWGLGFRVGFRAENLDEGCVHARWSPGGRQVTGGGFMVQGLGFRV